MLWRWLPRLFIQSRTKRARRLGCECARPRDANCQAIWRTAHGSLPRYVPSMRSKFSPSCVVMYRCLCNVYVNENAMATACLKCYKADLCSLFFMFFRESILFVSLRNDFSEMRSESCYDRFNIRFPQNDFDGCFKQNSSMLWTVYHSTHCVLLLVLILLQHSTANVLQWLGYHLYVNVNLLLKEGANIKHLSECG